MASTYSDRLRLELIATGEKNGTWGATTNTNLGTLLEEAISGYVAVTHDDTASYTLTTQNGASDEARNMVLNVGGALTAARNVVCPTKEKLYVVRNSTTGGFGFTFKTSGGAGIVVPNGKTMVLYCDGTNVLEGVNAVSSAFQLYDSTDATKRASFILSGITTATTRSFTLPDASTTLVGTDATQTLTNKTLGGNLAAGAFKLTGLGDGSARTDSVSAGQVQDGTLNWVAAAGTADIITATYAPAITALVDGQECCFRASAANTTTTPTFSPNGLTARTIVKRGGSALAVGDIPAAGAEVRVRYNLTNTRWEMINPGTGSASSTSEGVVELATTTEVLTGTDATRAVTPDALAALWETGGNVTDGATITIGSGGVFTLTASTVAITAFSITTDKVGRRFTCRFNTIRTLTNNAAITLPGGASITTAVGDMAGFRSLGGGSVECEWYTKISGAAVVPTSPITSLGSITCSGASASLGSLVLTDYKFLKLVLNGVSCDASRTILIGNSTADDVAFASTASAGATLYGVVEIDLATGIGVSSYSTASTAGNTVAFDSALSTSTTTITVATDAGSFDAGSIAVYGLI